MTMLVWLGSIWVVLLGASLGSFAGVCIARLPQGLSVVWPGSRCAACQTRLRWTDNLPLLSYLLLRGRCRTCQAPIGVRTWMLELLGAGLACALVTRLGVSFELLTWAPLCLALLVISFVDIDYFWVPDVVTYPGMVWAAGTALLPGRLGLAMATAGLLPAALLWATGWGFERLTGREAMGLGDIKLLAMLGLALGPAMALLLLLLASLQGAILGAVVVASGGHQGREEAPPEADGQLAGASDEAAWQPPPGAIPFGPFIALAAFEVLLLPDVFVAPHTQLVLFLARLFHLAEA